MRQVETSAHITPSIFSDVTIMTPLKMSMSCLRFQKSKCPWLHWSSAQSVYFESHVLPTLAAPGPLLVWHLNQVEVKGSPEGGQQSNSDTHCPCLFAEVSCLVLQTPTDDLFTSGSFYSYWNKVEGSQKRNWRSQSTQPGDAQFHGNSTKQRSSTRCETLAKLLTFSVLNSFICRIMKVPTSKTCSTGELN